MSVAATSASGGTVPAKEAARVSVFVHYRAFPCLLPLDRRDLQRALEAMLETVKLAPCAGGGVELHLVCDGAISKANACHLGCTGPTNVLSFPGGENFPGMLLLSLDTLGRECLLYGQRPEEYAVWLLAHGMGHLAGLDHGPAMDAVCARCAVSAMDALGLEARDGAD